MIVLSFTLLQPSICFSFGNSCFVSMLQPNRNSLNRLRAVSDESTNEMILNQIFSNAQSLESSLVSLEFKGIGDVKGNNDDVKCIILGLPSMSTNSFIPVPLPSESADDMVKLLSFAYRKQPISKSLCLQLSPLLINRDGSLFDNIPWSKWTIDPLRRNTDAAGNQIDEIYHLGKRDAYNRFIGKDWYGRSLSIGNVAARIKYMVDSDNKGKEDAMVFDEDAAIVLTRRVLEMEVKEARMALAEAQEQLAIIKANYGVNESGLFSDEVLIEHFDSIQSAFQSVQDAAASLDEREDAVRALDTPNDIQSNFVSRILENLLDVHSSDAPYRGATGYKPMIDSESELREKSLLPYSSPYELMKEIISQQLNAEIVGCVIEDTSLFNGSTVFGGALLLKRRGKMTKMYADGQEIEFEDTMNDFGNEGIKKGEVFIVECDCDEAIAMALTCNLNIYMDRTEWETSCISAKLEFETKSYGLFDSMPTLNSPIDSIKLETQGDGQESSNTTIQVPRNQRTMNFLSPSENNRPVFSSDIPVQSLSEFESLTTQDKAQILLSIDSFKGKLPRPRVLKKANSDNSLDPLDNLLIPLIDESVRRQILTREAIRKGDLEEATKLASRKSRRQIAKENAEQARLEGNIDMVRKWEEEASFYESLRADVTQDEGDYSSYLDRDEWYERTRQKLAEKNQKRFRTLFGDGTNE